MVRKKRRNFAPIGQILLRQRVINELQLEQALLLQQKQRQQSRLGSLLVEMGFAKENDILTAFSAQYAFPFLPLEHYVIPAEILHYIPFEVARKYCVIPVSKIGSTLTIAMADLLSTEDIAHLEAISECKIQIVLATRASIHHAIDSFYHNSNPHEASAPPAEVTVEPAQDQSIYGPVKNECTERRKCGRVPLDWDALIILHGGTKKHVRVVNVSSGGATIMIDEPLPEGQRIHVLLFNAAFLAQLIKPEFQLMQTIRLKKMSDQLTVLLSAFCDFMPKKEAWVSWSRAGAGGEWRVGLCFSMQPHPALTGQVKL